MYNDFLLVKKFSELTGLSRKSLYIYDQQEILKPMYVNPDTNYRYYHPNQILLAKRIKLLKEAHFSLNEIENVFQKQLTDKEINQLISEKQELKKREIEEAQQVIEHLNKLAEPVVFKTTPVEYHLDGILVYEFPLYTNENICVALNRVEEFSNKFQLEEVNERIIKYKVNENEIIPFSVAIPVDVSLKTSTGTVEYFDFTAQKFFYEVDPYSDDSVIQIEKIFATNPKLKKEGYVYEQILNTDDYLFSSNRLSAFIFPI